METYKLIVRCKSIIFLDELKEGETFRIGTNLFLITKIRYGGETFCNWLNHPMVCNHSFTRGLGYIVNPARGKPRRVIES